MRGSRLRFTILTAYCWIMMILLGSIVFETSIVYPNVFHDAPRSLEAGMAFMSQRAPSDFFPPLGFVSLVTGAGSILLGWPIRQARYWILASVVMILCEGLFSMAFFWPRNTVMFIEGSAVHPASVLRATALEFQRLHWARVVFNTASAAFIFKGVLAVHAHELTRRSAVSLESHA